MTTAELIKKRKEGQKNPVQPQVQPVFVRQSTTMGDNEGFSTPVETVNETQSNPVSLYEVGKGIKENASVKPDEVLNSTTLNPIKTPEYERFRNEVIGEKMFGVETPEQAAARERRDFIKQGLTGFTEGLSALANLYYTTKGAPSQKLTSQMPELSKRLYAERLERDKKLENFRAWQRAKAEQADERAYKEKLYNQQKEDAEKLRKETNAREDAKAAQTQANLDRQFEYQAERDKLADILRAEEREYTRKRNAKADALAWANLEFQKQKHEDTKNGKVTGKGSKSLRIEPVSTMKGIMDVDYSKINERNFIQLYNSVPDEIKEKYTFESYDDEKTREFMMNRAISEALETSNEYADKFEQLGIGSYRTPETKPSEPSDAKPKAESKGSKSLGGIGFIKSTKSNANAAPQPTYTETANVSATQEAVEAPKAPPIEQQGSKFDRLRAKYAKEDADEKEAKNLKLQKDIANMETEIRDSLNMANEYQKELDELNKIQMLDPRNYSGSRKREVEDAVNEVVSRKKYLEKEIKELKAKAKNINKEYEKLYPYKK